MVVGAVHQAIYACGLPPGVDMLITDVNFQLPSGSWWPGFAGQNFSIYKNTSDADKKKQLPIVVRRSNRDGYMGEAYLSSMSLWDSGVGPEIYLSFRLQGSTTIQGQTIDLSNVSGTVTISTTDWGKMGRPNYCQVAYKFEGQLPCSINNSIGWYAQPADTIMVLGARPVERKVGINATADRNAANELIEKVLQGIFLEHGSATGWVVSDI